MKNQATRKKSLIAGSVLAAALLTASCALAPRADGPVALAADSSWTYERRDSGSFGKGTAYQTNRTRSNQTWRGRMVRATEVPQGIRLSDAEKGDWLAVVQGDKTILTWEPSLGYDWPLSVGKSFSRNYRLVNHVSKQTTDIRATMTVQALAGR